MDVETHQAVFDSVPKPKGKTCRNEDWENPHHSSARHEHERRADPSDSQAGAPGGPGDGADRGGDSFGARGATTPMYVTPEKPAGSLEQVR